MIFFKCKHPFIALIVEKEQTVTVADEDFEHVDYHLRCILCKEQLTIEHARFIGGVDAFMTRHERAARKVLHDPSRSKRARTKQGMDLSSHD